MELTKERVTIIIAGAVLVALAGPYLFLYRPLINKCTGARTACVIVETKVLEARKAIGLLKKGVAKRTLISEKDISLAIDELTKQGRSKAINFTSITPREIKTSEDSRYQILPIDIEMESAYKEVALFLGSLEELEKSLVTVKDLRIFSDNERSTRLKTRLTVNMYLLGR